MMEQPHDRQPDVAALVAQLEQLNERSRWYSSRLWQEPLSFFGIVALALSSFHDQSDVLRGFTLIGLAALGFVLFVSMGSMKRAQRAAVEALARIEQHLGLQRVTEERRGISPPIRALVFVASLAFLVVGALFLAKGLKSPAQSLADAALSLSMNATRTNLPEQFQ